VNSIVRIADRMQKNLLCSFFIPHMFKLVARSFGIIVITCPSLEVMEYLTYHDLQYLVMTHSTDIEIRFGSLHSTPDAVSDNISS